MANAMASRVRCAAAAAAEPSSSFDDMAAELDNMTQQLDAPRQMRQTETAEEVAGRRARKQRELTKAAAVRAAGGAVRERLSERSGPRRSTLFDGDAWKEHASARARSMETTFTSLYKPTTGAYWTAQRNGTQPSTRRLHARPSASLVPSYASALPSALSLAQPAFRAMDELHGPDPAECASSGQGGAEVFEPFDPMEDPTRLFKDFKASAPPSPPSPPSLASPRSTPSGPPPSACPPATRDVTGAREHPAERSPGQASGSTPRVHRQRAASAGAQACAEGGGGRSRARQEARGVSAARRPRASGDGHLPHVSPRRRGRGAQLGAAPRSVGRVGSGRTARVGRRRVAAVKQCSGIPAGRRNRVLSVQALFFRTRGATFPLI